MEDGWKVKVDGSINAASISPCGRDVVLASRKGLIVVDLDNPYDPPRFLHHLTAWEVADVQWSPHAKRDAWVVSTSNQKALVWNLEAPSSSARQHVLHGHDRAITDINFHAHHLDILATCSIDTFIHVWDLRDPTRPAFSFAEWRAGATQIKWNRQDEHLLASSHDRFLFVWDDRKGSSPVSKIAAHDTKIYGIDWNRTRASGILTCSLDKTVKFWDYKKNEIEPEHTIHTTFPVWRARHTPFGWGCMVMPQRGADHALHLYDRRASGDTYDPPVERFEGHTDQVKEFLFRAHGGSSVSSVDDRDFSMVTWGKDQELRVWPIDRGVLETIGQDARKPTRFRLTRRGAEYKTFRVEPEPTPRTTTTSPSSKTPSSAALASSLTSMNAPPPAGVPRARVRDEGTMTKRSQLGPQRHQLNPLHWMKGVRLGNRLEWNQGPESLGEELALVGQKFPKIKYDAVNVASRKCTVALYGPWGPTSEGERGIVFFRVTISFPTNYPATPSLLEIEKTGVIAEDTINEMHQHLQHIIALHAARKRPSVEPCIRFLLGELVQDEPFDSESSSHSSEDDEVILKNDTEGPQLKNAIPLAKGSGASFSPSGKLVCFFPAARDAIREVGGNVDRRGRFVESFGTFTRQPSPSPARSTLSSASSSPSLLSDDDLLIKPPPSWHFNETFNVKLPTELTERTSPAKSRQTVSIHELPELTPSREVLARDYLIMGNPAQVCWHNMHVAYEHGYSELGDVWSLAELIVSQSIPMEQKHSDVVSSERGWIDGGKIKFGYHILGSIVGDLFSYYEKKADVQMLAMLACVFSDAVDGLGQKGLSDYFSSHDHFHLSLQPASNPSPQLHTPYTVSIPSSYGDNEMHSTGVTPPTPGFRMPDGWMDESAEHYTERQLDRLSERHVRKFTGPSSTRAAVAMQSASPSSKKVSPAESWNGAGVSWGATMSVHATRASPSATFDEASNVVKVCMVHSNEFDDEFSPVAKNLVDPLYAGRLCSYRAYYANMLFTWGLLSQRLEMLKYNGRDMATSALSSSSFAKKMSPPRRAESLAGSIGCQSCAGKINYETLACDRCGSHGGRLRCSYCACFIKGRFTACGKCEHAGHVDCLTAWFTGPDQPCPKGCGCFCLAQE